ncbi:hypothetical protein C8R43DRAFT_1036390 [Mycena crocata]|nr:hypothetical protein C8R43DRAFT_1036390 [Mycena crocata]
MCIIQVAVQRIHGLWLGLSSTRGRTRCVTPRSQNFQRLRFSIRSEERKQHPALPLRSRRAAAPDIPSMCAALAITVHYVSHIIGGLTAAVFDLHAAECPDSIFALLRPAAAAPSSPAPPAPYPGYRHALPARLRRRFGPVQQQCPPGFVRRAAGARVSPSLSTHTFDCEHTTNKLPAPIAPWRLLGRGPDVTACAVALRRCTLLYCRPPHSLWMLAPPRPFCPFPFSR